MNGVPVRKNRKAKLPVATYRMFPLVAIASLAIAMSGCQNGGGSAKPEVPAPKVVTLRAGTPVSLVLMTPLESGGTPEGSVVAFMVADDVRDEAGNVLIPKGSPAQGEVSWSRREEMLGGLTNRPARLKVALKATVDAAGQPVDLCADTAKPEEPYELNRGNTGTQGAAASLDALMQDDQDKAVIEALSQTLDGADNALLEADDSRQRLSRIAEKLNMPSLQSLAQQNQLGKAKNLLNQMRRTDPVNEVARHMTSDAPALAALLEWTGVSTAVQGRLEGLTHGRNIKAYLGTPVTAFVAKDGTVTVPSK